MCADRQQIDAAFFGEDRYLSESLHRVHMKEGGCALAFEDGRNGVYGFDRTQLVVDIHQAHKDRFFVDRVFQRRNRYRAEAIHGKNDDLKALFAETFVCLQHAGVLHGGDHHAVPLAPPRCRGAEDGEVVGLGAAGGEGQTFRAAAKGDRHGLPCFFAQLFGRKAQLVQRRGVAPVGLHGGQHPLLCRVAKRRGGAVVKISLHLDTPLHYSYRTLYYK